VIPRKENPERFQSTWVEIAMLAAEDAVAAMTGVAEAVEDMAGPHPVQYHLSHQKLGHAKTWKVTYSPSALVTRARTVTCYEHL
jgi:lauroyl/myristoyl acyltransferase